MRLAVLIASMVAFIVYVPFFLFPQTCIVANWTAAGNYVKEMQQYNDNHHLVFDSFNLDTKDTTPTENAWNYHSRHRRIQFP